MLDKKVDQFVAWLKESRHFTAFTGAGIRLASLSFQLVLHRFGPFDADIARTPRFRGLLFILRPYVQFI